MATTLPYNGPTPAGSGGSVIQGQNIPAGGAPYTYPWIRFQPSANLANGNNVVDLVMPGGPASPQTWYVVVYTFNAGTIS